MLHGVLYDPCQGRGWFGTGLKVLTFWVPPNGTDHLGCCN